MHIPINLNLRFRMMGPSSGIQLRNLQSLKTSHLCLHRTRATLTTVPQMPRSTNARQRDHHTERIINGCYVCMTHIGEEQGHRQLATDAANTRYSALYSQNVRQLSWRQRQSKSFVQHWLTVITKTNI